MKGYTNMLTVVTSGWRNRGWYFFPFFPCVLIFLNLTMKMHYISNQKLRRSFHFGEQ